MNVHSFILFHFFTPGSDPYHLCCSSKNSLAAVRCSCSKKETLMKLALIFYRNILHLLKKIKNLKLILLNLSFNEANFWIFLDYFVIQIWLNIHKRYRTMVVILYCNQRVVDFLNTISGAYIWIIFAFCDFSSSCFQNFFLLFCIRWRPYNSHESDEQA